MANKYFGNKIDNSKRKGQKYKIAASNIYRKRHIKQIMAGGKASDMTLWQVIKNNGKYSGKKNNKRHKERREKQNSSK